MLAAAAAVMGLAAHLAFSILYEAVAFVRAFCTSFVREFRAGAARGRRHVALQDARARGPWAGPGDKVRH